MLKPVYFKDSELPKAKDERVSNFAILEAVTECVGDTVRCIQLDRDLWRIYLTTKGSRDLILVEGFDFNSQHVSVYDSNPYSVGLDSPDDKTLKVTICGLPISVDDSAVHSMLTKLGARRKSDIKFEKIRNSKNGKMTNVLNGNRFVYIEDIQNPLPRFSYCAGLKCKILHRGQDFEKPTITCTNCWESGHSFHNCVNTSKCAACKQPGHEPGSENCPHFVEDSNVEAFNGEKNVLSNFYPCDLSINGENFRSAEQAYQVIKAVRCGDLVAAEKLREAKTALECKLIGNSVSETHQWHIDKEKTMEKIVDQKIEQVNKLKKLLTESTPETVYAHSVYDMFWGSGLDAEKTKSTKTDAWPGKNVMGKIMQRCAEKCRQKKEKTEKRKTRQQNIKGYLG